jgi:hypothetical protein
MITVSENLKGQIKRIVRLAKSGLEVELPVECVKQALSRLILGFLEVRV